MDENASNEENNIPPRMAEEDRGVEDDNAYDVNSLDIQSRSDGSIALALDFRPGFNVSHRTSNGRKSLSTRKSGTKSKRTIRSNIVKTRAPPKKSYEPAPFLIIDNLTDSKRNQTTNISKKDTAKSQTTSYSHSLTVPRNTPTPTPTGRSSAGFQRIGSGRTLSCSSSEWNKLVPRKSRALYKQVTERQPNQHVQSPFKHTASASNMEKSIVLPDQRLKELTVLATYEVAKAIAKQQPETEHKIQGRLLKARLKPLNTVNVSGPTINQCRGIVAGAHSYKPSPNRTLQRRRQLLQNLNKDYMRDRPQTAESIHHTSVASDNTDARDQEELDYLLLASAGLDEHEAQVFGIPPNSLASFGDATSHQIGHLTGREIAEFAIDSSFSSNNVSARDQRPDKVEEVGSEEDPDIQEVAEAEKYFLEFDDDAKRSSDITTNTPVNSSSLHRPMSMHDTGLRKSVRFADATNGRTDIHKGRSRSAMPCFRQDRIPNPRHSEVAQNTKQKGRSSCRPSSTEVMNSWHDDTGHDPGSGDGTHRSGAWSVNSVMSSNSTNTNQTAPPKKSSGGGNTEKSEVLCTSIGEVKFDSDEVCTSADRPPSQMTTRLRPRLGEWEDIIKPEDCGNLVISGKSKDMTERETDVRSMPFKRAGCTTPRGKRPQSAKGPYEFITEEKRQMVLKARPVSARAECPGLDSSVSTMSAVLNVRPQSGRKPSVISPRPQSARNKSVAKTAAVISSKCLRPSSGRFKKSNSAKQQKTKRHHGQEVREDRSGSKPCSYCGQPTDKDINYENGSYFIVCRNCSHQSCNMEVANDTRVAVPDDDECWDLNVNEVAKCLATEMLQRKGQELESGSTNDNTVITSGSYQGMQYGRQGNHGSQVIYSVRDQADSVNTEPSNPVDCPANEVTGDPESNTISSSQKEALKEEGQILSNLDLLEKSLADVQTEIKDCLRQTRSFDDDDDDDKNDVPDDSDVKSSSASKIMEPEPSRNGDVSQQLCEGGFSSKLVGDIDHHWEAVEDNIKVYQFVEKDTDMKKQDGGVMRNMNNNISSYEATMVSPLKPGNSTQATEQAFSVQLQEPMSGGQKEGSSVDNSVSPSSGDSLEVKATTKNILKQMSENGSHPICPHPALSFTINARPPQGYMYYFAYGMDMNPDRLSTYIHRHITERFWGLLFGFKLLFNKKGVDEEAGGFPNIELCDHSSVEGCLQLITPAELNHLDRCFGYPEHYTHVVLPVWQLNCSEADDLGVAQYCVPAVMYVARDRWTHRGDTPLDSSYASDQCLKGTTFLSPEYTKQLQQNRDLN